MATKLSAAKARASFIARAPKVMGWLMADFKGLDVEAAAAVLGNFWAESRLQAVGEIAPTVKGSLGGFGWDQSTGPRRRAAFAFWAKRKMDPQTDEAEYAWIFYQLRYTAEKKALPALMRPGLNLHAKAKVFCDVYERPGVKNYAARYEGADMALRAWFDNPQHVEPHPDVAPVEVKPMFGEDLLTPTEVITLQERLHSAGFGHLVGKTGVRKNGVDGCYGPHTITAVFAFQQAHGLPADGHWNEATRLALVEATKPAPQPEKAPPMVQIDFSRLPAPGKIAATAGFLGGLAATFGMPEAAKLLGLVNEGNLSVVYQFIGVAGSVVTVIAGLLPSTKAA